jgi:hypothetical protein
MLWNGIQGLGLKQFLWNHLNKANWHYILNLEYDRRNCELLQWTLFHGISFENEICRWIHFHYALIYALCRKRIYKSLQTLLMKASGVTWYQSCILTHTEWSDCRYPVWWTWSSSKESLILCLCHWSGLRRDHFCLAFKRSLVLISKERRLSVREFWLSSTHSSKCEYRIFKYPTSFLWQQSLIFAIFYVV